MTSPATDDDEDIPLFQMAVLSTKEAEYEVKLKKGRGKFKITSKESAHLDREEIMNQSLKGVKDQKTIRKVLIYRLHPSSHYYYSFTYAF